MAVQNDPASRERPKKRKKPMIALGVVLILIAALAGVAVWQKNNIEAVKQFSQYSQEELEQQLQDNDKQVEELLQAALEAAKQVDAEAQQSPNAEAGTKPEPDAEDKTDVTGPAPSDSETKAPASVPEAPKAEQPQSTPNDGKPQSQTPTAQQPAGEKVPEPQKPVTTGPTYEQQLKAVTDKVYALRSQYLRALDDLQAEAVAAYKAMPKDQRTKKALASFVSTYISKATTLEKTCDGQMDALISELTQLQKKYGQSMELVDSVKYTYANEKSLKKAWYMSELKQRGLI